MRPVSQGPFAPKGRDVKLPDVEEAFRSGEIFRDPHGVYRRLRERAPVYWSSYLGQWLVTSHELVQEALLKPRVLSNFGFDTGYIGRLPNGDRAQVPTLDHHFRQHGLIQADPPEHTRLRRALGGHFTAKVVQQLEDRIQTSAGELLSSAPDDLDVIRDLAGPLPVRVIAELLGVDRKEREGFPRWSADAVRFFGTPVPDPDNARRLDHDLVEWRGLLERLLEERASDPRDDLLSAVAQLVVAGTISHEEALFTCVHLLIAGHETTTNLIGNTLLCLLGHRDALAATLEDRAFLPSAIEEVLRFEPPIQRVRRVAAEACELGGVAIAAGEPVIPVLAAANRDPSRFDDPDRFDISRDLIGSGQRHASFGLGVHFCIGAPLARLEVSIAVQAVLERQPQAGLPDGFVPEWRPTINMRGLRSLPITA